MEEQNPATTFASPGRHRVSARWYILHHPFTRFVFGNIAIFLIPSIAVAISVAALLRMTGHREILERDSPDLQSPSILAFAEVVQAVVALPLYIGFVRLLEWRRPSELINRMAMRDFAAGTAIGCGLIALVMGILVTLDAFRFVRFADSPNVLLVPAVFGIGSGVFEEILFRGVWFRILEEWLGTGISLLLSALIFGVLHLMNPGASLVSCLAISVEAGLILASAYLLTRRLWMSIGIHASWNFTLGGIFGANVSGLPMPGLSDLKPIGPDWLTGGGFGPEASAATLAVGTVAGGAILMLAVRRGAWRPLFVRTPLTAPALAGDSVVATGFLPTADHGGHPAPAEDQPERGPQAAPENGPDIVDEP